MKGKSPTQRTLEYARKAGWIVDVVERWIPRANIRKDLFGCIDLVAIAGDSIVGIQACADASHAARRTKALAEKRLAGWLAAGGKFEVWSWGKKGPRGKAKRWTLRREALTRADMPAVPISDSSALAVASLALLAYVRERHPKDFEPGGSGFTHAPYKALAEILSRQIDGPNWLRGPDAQAKLDI